MAKKRRLDADRKSSDLPGFAGIFETFIRRFKNLAFAVMITPIMFMGIFCLACALTPAILFYDWFTSFFVDSNIYMKAFTAAFAVSTGYFIYGFTLIFVVPLVNFILPLKIKPWRGIWYSLQSIPWYVHNALTYLVRYTFLEWMTPSPVNVMFYRMMGMKVGKGVVINTTNISDPAMITLEDNVTVGGSAHIFGHYGQKGVLILAPVVIKKNVTIGLKASIMGDVIIEEGAVISPHTVLLPKSRIGPRETV